MKLQYTVPIMWVGSELCKPHPSLDLGVDVRIDVFVLGLYGHCGTAFLTVGMRL